MINKKKVIGLVAAIGVMIGTASMISNAYIPDFVTGVSGIYCNGDNKLFAVYYRPLKIGYSESYVLEQFDTPQRTEESEYGFTWYIYEASQLYACKIGIKDGKVAAIYMDTKYCSFNQLDYIPEDENYEAQRIRLFVTNASTVRSYFGNPVNSSTNSDVFFYDNNYITATYNDSGIITSMKVMAPYTFKANPGRTNEELKNKWAIYSPKYTGGVYAQTPSLVEPYKSGSLNSGFLNDGLNMFNFVRYTIGYPDDVTLSDGYSQGCQYGSVINQLVSNPRTTNPHDPERPSGMVGKPEYDEFYTIGRNACRLSNIMWASNMSVTLWWDVEQWMDDSGVADLGHRHHMIHPKTGKVGFGFCGNWSSMYIADNSTPRTPFQCVTWPSNGNFPLRFFNGSLLWSAEFFSPLLLDNKINKDEVKVQITRKSDGTVWNIYKGSSDGSLDVSIYFPQQLIFRFNPGAYQSGTEYNVKITNISLNDGTKGSMEYNVKLTDLK